MCLRGFSLQTYLTHREKSDRCLVFVTARPLPAAREFVMILQQYYFSINNISKNQSNSIKLLLRDIQYDIIDKKCENPHRQLCWINLKCNDNRTSYINIKICIIIETKRRAKKWELKFTQAPKSINYAAGSKSGFNSACVCVWDFVHG